MKTKKELTVIEINFVFGGNNGNYYLKDEDGNVYYWNTASEKAYDELKEGTTHTCSFVATNNTWNYKDTLVTTIKNVRF